MPTTTSLLDNINNEPCLIKFMNQPITYKSESLDVTIEYYHSENLPIHLQTWVFDVVKNNLYDLYVKSNDGWNETEKKKELLAPEARYLIVKSKAKEEGEEDYLGYLMFQMVQEETMDEDDRMANVAYCYELQLIEKARNQGLGEYLMKLLMDIGSYWKLEKAMLTVFKSNKGAFRFYTKKMGFELDEISPGACLSARKAKQFDYEILSKPLNN
ncbi:unnamed protein product [Cunninghamella blakesleeana]